VNFFYREDFLCVYAELFTSGKKSSGSSVRRAYPPG
jgi:hypothetical protein